jgi:hypothetical protein
MACVFCGMPALIEDNKNVLIHFRNRGYRGYSINRFDKPMNKLSQTERDLGGVPSSELILSQHTGQVSKLTSINTLVTIRTKCFTYSRRRGYGRYAIR